MEQRLRVSVVPGSTRSLQLSVRCGLAQDLTLRCVICRRWWRRGDSNFCPSRCKGDALPTELRPLAAGNVVGVSGLEPETSALSGQCSNQLS